MEKRMAEIAARKIEIRKALDDGAEMDLDAIQTELNSLEAEETELRKKADIAAKLVENPALGTDVVEQRNGDMEMENKIDSMEYRKAFMDYIATGEMAMEFRDVAMTKDNAAVIPAVTLNTIIEKLESYGEILPLVKKISYPSGAVVPTSVTKPVASWLSEGAAIEVQDKKTGKLVFASFELACAAGVSLQMDVSSLTAFEATLINNIVEAMTRALEAAIVSGDGNGKPTGILSATPVATVSLSAKLGYADIINVEKAIPKAYKTGAVYLMAENTFLSFMGMVDAQGQPVAKVNFGVDGAPARMLFGRRVVTTEYITDIDAAAAGTPVAVVVNPQHYVLNTAYALNMRQYIDNPTNKKVWQAVTLVDGKLADANGLVFVNKAGTAAKG